MEAHYHMAVWIDHHEARVFGLNAERYDRVLVRPRNAAEHLHHKANTTGSGRTPEDQEFYRDVAKAIASAGAVLVMGPASAKTEFLKHLEKHEPNLLPKIAGVEGADHMTDGEVVARARKHFGPEHMQPGRER
ncbi:MAG TPA: translational machinery protein [Xanthobacteraceae bacterium]|nr:translational machinery protein [Xanthobacteraceae bacterium]